VINKYLALFRDILEHDPSFKVDTLTKMLAFALDKSVDARLEENADKTFLAYLKRSNNEDFHDVLALLVQKQSYFNV